MGPKALLAIALILSATAASAKPGSLPLDPLLARWDGDPHPDLKGVIVLRDGRIIGERYYNGADRNRLHDIRSAGKSITALMVGIAVDRGTIANVDDPVDRYWKDAAGTAIGDVTIAQVLTMRSGLAAYDEDATSPGHEDRMDEAADPARFILSLPRATAPGTVYCYNSVTAAVAGILVAKASGTDMEALAAAHLFKPLGIRRWRWDRDASGFTKGQGNLSLTLRDTAVIGEMVRGEGVYKGRRVIGTAWIRQATAPHVVIGDVDRYADDYGFMWYGKAQPAGGGAVRVSFASGNGGNKIYVVPDRHLVVAIQSSAYGKGYGQKRSEEILKAILSVEAE
jgi:CubicO group peptidase (beta-lactamase class C family)